VSSDAIALVTAALRSRLEAAVHKQIYVGPPVAEDVNAGGHPLALFLFHLVPNQELRNRQAHVPRSADPLEPLVEADGLPLDLRYLISVFRTGGGGGGMADPGELLTLGQAIRELHHRPTIDDSQVPNQLARITPEPYPMEEMSRVWGLFPETSYRTSMVYLVSPVYVLLDPAPAGRPVLERHDRQGPFADRPHSPVGSSAGGGGS
jgi:hypothetical protein